MVNLTRAIKLSIYSLINFADYGSYLRFSISFDMVLSLLSSLPLVVTCPLRIKDHDMDVFALCFFSFSILIFDLLVRTDLGVASK